MYITPLDPGLNYLLLVIYLGSLRCFVILSSLHSNFPIPKALNFIFNSQHQFEANSDLPFKDFNGNMMGDSIHGLANLI